MAAIFDDKYGDWLVTYWISSFYKNIFQISILNIYYSDYI